MREQRAPLPPLLVDQGTQDKFLAEQLRPELFQEACAAAGQPLTLRKQEGYDHSYYFVSTFMEDHLRHHAAALNASRLPAPFASAWRAFESMASRR